MTCNFALHLVASCDLSFDGWDDFEFFSMPKIAKELGPLDVKRLTHSGGKNNSMVAVGGVSGLYLQLTPTGGKSWILRTVVGTKRTDIGLGGFPTVTLAQAREKARQAREKLEKGIDPVAERRDAKTRLIAARRKGLTFEEAVENALTAKLDAFRNKKHRDQWRNTLVQYAIPVIGTLPLQEIDTAAVLRVLSQEVKDKAGNLEGTLWQTRTETASRLRGRIEAVLSWATVAGERSGDNPARWAGNMKELLPAASTIAVEENQPALSLDDAPRWFADLRTRQGFGARALEFVALTAGRSGDVRGALWDEIDLAKGLWVISATRMKMKREHRVPLPPIAIEMLERLPRLDGNPLIFPAARGGKLSDMTLSATMKRMHGADVLNGGIGYFDARSKRIAVPHGLRSTFRDWVSEKTSYPSEMAEIALAHKINNTVEAAYRRGDMVEKRRDMMDAWANFLINHENTCAKVVRMR